MKKRWMTALLALALVLAMLPAPARAAAAQDTAGSRLTGVDREVYDYLRAEIGKIARGERADTDIKIPDLSALSWTLQELGGQGSLASRVERKVKDTVHIERIYDCLAADCPYDLYWRGDRFTWGYRSAQLGDRVSVRDLRVRFQVAQGYRGGGDTRVSRAKIAAAARAAEVAQSIVDRHEDETDFDKLTAYRDEICRLTEYDSAAAAGRTAYGDPWQLIYVFDGDPDTNVVCEGYAKAFQYLCDLSQFRGDVTCRTVSGEMDGGNHMWNLVRMGDGKHYLADITNSDSGTIGAEGQLFLSGAAASGGGRTYTVSKGACHAVYTFGEEQEGLFSDGWLAVSETDCVPGADEPRPEGPFTDVDPSAYYAGAAAWAVQEGIARGTTDTTFSPGERCTQGQILTFLWRAAGEPVSRGDAPLVLGEEVYYAPAVRWASQLGMLAADFDPEAGCSRADAVWYIWRAFGGPDAAWAGFTDVPADAPYARAVDWALARGVTTGATPATFQPDAICDRGEIVTFLYRAYCPGDRLEP